MQASAISVACRRGSDPRGLFPGQGGLQRSAPGDAIKHLSAPLARITAGDGLQIRQGLLAEAALVGLGAVLEQPVQGLGQVADLQRGHGVAHTP